MLPAQRVAAARHRLHHERGRRVPRHLRRAAAHAETTGEVLWGTSCEYIFPFF